MLTEELWVWQYLSELLPVRRVVADSIGTKGQCLQKQLQDCEKQSKAKAMEGHLVHWLTVFDRYYDIPRIISLSEKKLQRDIF